MKRINFKKLATYAMLTLTLTSFVNTSFVGSAKAAEGNNTSAPMSDVDGIVRRMTIDPDVYATKFSVTSTSGLDNQNTSKKSAAANLYNVKNNATGIGNEEGPSADGDWQGTTKGKSAASRNAFPIGDSATSIVYPKAINYKVGDVLMADGTAKAPASAPADAREKITVAYNSVGTVQQAVHGGGVIDVPVGAVVTLSDIVLGYVPSWYNSNVSIMLSNSLYSGMWYAGIQSMAMNVTFYATTDLEKMMANPTKTPAELGIKPVEFQKNQLTDTDNNLKPASVFTFLSLNSHSNDTSKIAKASATVKGQNNYEFAASMDNAEGVLADGTYTSVHAATTAGSPTLSPETLNKLSTTYYAAKDPAGYTDKFTNDVYPLLGVAFQMDGTTQNFKFGNSNGYTYNSFVSTSLQPVLQDEPTKVVQPIVKGESLKDSWEKRDANSLDRFTHVGDDSPIVKQNDDVNYFINQATINVASQSLVQPHYYEIKDTLPEGTKLSSADNNLVLYNLDGTVLPLAASDWTYDADTRKLVVKISEANSKKINDLSKDTSKHDTFGGDLSLRITATVTKKYADDPFKDLIVNTAQTIFHYWGDGVKKTGDITGTADTNDVAINVGPGPLQAKLTKFDDEKNLLPGATFALQNTDGTPVKDYDGKIVDPQVTDANGEVNFTQLNPGNYQFVETKAPKGYDIDAKNNVYPVSVASAMVITDGVAANTDYELQQASYDKAAQKWVYTKATKDVDGAALPATFNSSDTAQVKLVSLAAGRYRLVAAGQPDVNFTNNIASDAINNSQAGSVILTKQDSITKAPLAGAQFKLYQIINGTDQAVTTDTTGKAITTADLTTDANGALRIDNLKHGQYKLVETAAPTGYAKATGAAAEKTFDITRGDVTGDATNPLIIANDELGQITVTKTDSVSGKALAKVDFALLDSNDKVVTTQTTDANGQLKFTNLAAGKYTVKEVKAPNGYALTADSTQTVTLALGQTTAKRAVTVNVKNTPLGNVTLTKVDAQDATKKLVGAQFQLIDAAGKVVPEDGNGNALPATYTTDKDGQITVNNLIPGAYSFVEVSAPAGFAMPTGKASQTAVTVKPSTTATVTVKNDELGQINLTKTDSVTGKVLANVTFELRNANDITGTVLATATTDANGQLTFKNLAAGNYTVTEKAAPFGYLLTAGSVQTVTVALGAKQNVAVTNDPLATIKVTKVDAQTNAVLANAEFTLLDGKGQPVVKDGNGNALPATFITNGSGQLEITNLVPGAYQLKETKAPADHYISQATTATTVSAGDVKNVTVPNNQLGNVTLTKYDAQDTTKTLAGAQFKLVDAAGKVVTEDGNGAALPATFTTDKAGQITVKNLIPGNYTFVELTAPAGFATPTGDAAKTAIEVKTGATAQAKVVNDEFGQAILTKVDAADGKPVAGAVFELQDARGNVVTKDADGNALQATYTTDASGQIVVKNLQAGAYVFSEVKAATGYYLPTEGVKSAELAVADGTTTKTTVKNDKLVLGQLTLIKQDSLDATKTLAGAEFKLQNSSDEFVKNTDGTNIFTTDENGEITVNNLPHDTYHFVETKAPAGYYLPTNGYTTPDIKIGQSDAKEVTVANDKLGAVEVTKVDEKDATKVLAGAEFELRDSDDKLVGTKTTDEAGQLDFAGLQPGKYTLTETVAPKGYELPTGTRASHELDVQVGAPTKVTVDNEKTLFGTLAVEKVDATTGALLPDATYTLKNAKGDLVATETTDDNGKLAFTNLPAGDYTLQEKLAPAGYNVSSTVYTVTIPYQPTTTVKQTVSDTKTVEDKNNRGAIIVHKIDDATGKALANAKFELHQAGKLVQTKTTNANGDANFNGLAAGNYTLVEVRAPKGYELSDETFKATVLPNQIAPFELTVANVPTATPADPNDPSDGADTPDNPAKPGDPTDSTGKTNVPNTKKVLKIVTVDSKTKVKVPNVKYGIYTPKGKLIKIVTPNEDGEIDITEFPPGDYIVRQTNTDNDHEIDPNEVTITVTDKPNTPIKVTVPNTPKPKQRLVLINIDGKTKDKLSKSIFVLRDKKTGKVLATKTTDDHGDVDFGELLTGDYEITQITPHNGYLRATQTYTVTLDGSKPEYSVTVPNYKNKLSVKVATPKQAKTPAPKTMVVNVNKPAHKVTNKASKTPMATVTKAPKAPTNKRVYNFKQKLAQTGFQAGINWFGLVIGVALLGLAAWMLRRKHAK